MPMMNWQGVSAGAARACMGPRIQFPSETGIGFVNQQGPVVIANLSPLRAWPDLDAFKWFKILFKLKFLFGACIAREQEKA